MFGPDGVQGFLGRPNGFMNLPVLQECELLGRNVGGQNGLEPIGNYFLYDLIEYVTERDGAEVIKR